MPKHLPIAIYVLTTGTFLMGTSEFVVAGLLPEMAAGFDTTIAHAGLTITIFAVGMIIGAPSMALATLRIPRRITLTIALGVFALGHIIVAVTHTFEIVLAARFLTALATSAFWAVGSVAAARIVNPTMVGRALGVVLGGGMLANVLGVPLGSFSGQMIGWRGTFWALAALALLAAIAVTRLIPTNDPSQETPSIRAELQALRNTRLWLVLTMCIAITGSVLSIYSYIAPLIDNAGLPNNVIPIALMMFGMGALIGSIICGRLGDTHPYATMLVTTITTVIFSAAIWMSSTTPTLLLWFTLLGLVGLSANPILVALAVRFGGNAPTLAGAMPTSLFNLGTAIGTGITSAALNTSLGATAPAIVGTLFAIMILFPLVGLILLERSTMKE